MKNPRHRVSLWIFLVALTTRALYLQQYMASPLRDHLGVDHAYYLGWAGRIAAGDWLGTAVFEQAPLYAYLLAGALLLVGDWIMLVPMAQLVIGAGACVLVYQCGRRLMDERVAAAAGFMAAIYGPLVFYECAFMKSFLSPTLSLVALYAGLRYGERRQWPWLCLVGSAIGLACLVRENHILLLLPFVLWIWIGPTESRPEHRQRVAHMGILVLCIGLWLTPTTLRNGYVGGEFVVVTAAGGEAFYLGQGPWANGYYIAPPFVLSRPGVEHEDFRREAERRSGHEMSRKEVSQFWFQQGLQHLLENPYRAAQLILVKALILLNDFEVPDNADYRVTRQFIPLLGFLPTFGWVGALGMLGMAVSCKHWRRFQLPLGIMATHAVSILVLYNFGRFRLGMMPFWILFCAYGVNWLISRWQARPERSIAQPRDYRRLTAVLALCLAGMMTAAMYYPHQPLNYEIHTASTTGHLALDSGELDLAERQLRQALRLRETELARAGPTDTRHYNLARDHQALALLLLRTDKPMEAITQLRRARHTPNRPEVRGQLLAFELALLDTALRSNPPPAAAAALRAEVKAVERELRALNPEVSSAGAQEKNSSQTHPLSP